MKNERFHNSRIFDCFRRFICFFSCFILCICFIPYNISYAVDSTSIDVLYYNSPDSALIGGPHEGITYATYSDSYYNVFKDSEDFNCYFFSAMRNSNKYVYFIVDGDTYRNASSSFTFGHWTARSGQAITKSTLSLNSTYDLAVVRSYNDFSSAYTMNCMHFSSEDEGLAYVRNYIDNPPSTDPIYEDLPDFNIQRGYAAYIDFGSNWSSRSCSGTLTSSFPQYSSLISGDWDGTDNRRYFWTDSLPTNTSFSSNVGNAIDWTKVGPYDLLQRSKNGIWFIQSNSPQNRYLVIVNPNQWRYGQNPSDDTINSPIKVSDLSGSTGEVQFFALNQQFDQNGTLVSSASDQASNNRTGTYDPDTGEWSSTDSSGTSADQVPGGQSDTPVISSITDYISSITTTLTNFANSVIALIQAPISHISQLIEAGSGFMGALRGMYAWLPVDIQGLVISALTVVIGIGVFKVFL